MAHFEDIFKAADWLNASGIRSTRTSTGIISMDRMQNMMDYIYGPGGIGRTGDNWKDVNLDGTPAIPTALDASLTPTQMPTIGDPSVVKAGITAQRRVSNKKGRASTILTGRFAGMAGKSPGPGPTPPTPMNTAVNTNVVPNTPAPVVGWDGGIWNSTSILRLSGRLF